MSLDAHNFHDTGVHINLFKQAPLHSKVHKTQIQNLTLIRFMNNNFLLKRKTFFLFSTVTLKRVLPLIKIAELILSHYESSSQAQNHLKFCRRWKTCSRPYFNF